MFIASDKSPEAFNIKASGGGWVPDLFLIPTSIKKIRPRFH